MPIDSISGMQMENGGGSVCLSACGDVLSQLTGKDKKVAFLNIYINDVTDRPKGAIIHLSFWFFIHHR